MTVLKDCILWPVQFDSASETLSVAVNDGGFLGEDLTMSVTVGRNYWLSGDGQADSDPASVGGIGDLVTMLQDLLNTHTLAAGGFTVTITDQGIVTISHSTFEFQVGWNDPVSSTLEPEIFGFTRVVLTGGLTYSSPNQSTGIWYSGKTRSRDSRNRQPVVGAVAETISGLARVSRLSLPNKGRELGWIYVPQAKALTEYAPATEPYGAFESAWIDSISKGQAWRMYDDASTRTSSSYDLYRTQNLDDPLMRSSAPTRFDVSIMGVLLA